tara:strand:- start:925 stop:2079 length:1155 start_codon:yes stop_codon:yes gene_type:complete
MMNQAFAQDEESGRWVWMGRDGRGGVVGELVSLDNGEGRGVGVSGLDARRARDAMWRKLGRQAKGTAKAKAMVAKDAPRATRWRIPEGGSVWDGKEVKTILVRTKKTGVERARTLARRKAIATLFWKCMNVREFFEMVGHYYYRTPSALALDYDWVGRERWVSRTGTPASPERMWSLRSNAERTLAWSWTREVRTLIETLESLWEAEEESQEKMRMWVRPYVGTGMRRRERKRLEIRRDFGQVRMCMMGWYHDSKWVVRGGHHGTSDGSGGVRAFGALGGRCGTGGNTLRECLEHYNRLVSETVMERCVSDDCECCGGEWKTGRWAAWIETSHRFGGYGGRSREDKWKAVRDNAPEVVAKMIFADWKGSFVRHYEAEARERGWV